MFNQLQAKFCGKEGGVSGDVQEEIAKIFITIRGNGAHGFDSHLATFTRNWLNVDGRQAFALDAPMAGRFDMGKQIHAPRFLLTLILDYFGQRTSDLEKVKGLVKKQRDGFLEILKTKDEELRELFAKFCHSMLPERSKRFIMMQRKSDLEIEARSIGDIDIGERLQMLRDGEERAREDRKERKEETIEVYKELVEGLDPYKALEGLGPKLLDEAGLLVTKEFALKIEALIISLRGRTMNESMKLIFRAIGILVGGAKKGPEKVLEEMHKGSLEGFMNKLKEEILKEVRNKDGAAISVRMNDLRGILAEIDTLLRIKEANKNQDYFVSNVDENGNVFPRVLKSDVKELHMLLLKLERFAFSKNLTRASKARSDQNKEEFERIVAEGEEVPRGLGSGAGVAKEVMSIDAAAHRDKNIPVVVSSASHESSGFFKDTSLVAKKRAALVRSQVESSFFVMIMKRCSGVKAGEGEDSKNLTLRALESVELVCYLGELILGRSGVQGEVDVPTWIGRLMDSLNISQETNNLGTPSEIKVSEWSGMGQRGANRSAVLRTLPTK